MNTLQRHFVTTYTLAAYPSANNVYKLCTIVYKCLHAAAPSYLTEMCVPVAASTGRRCLRSAARGVTVTVPRTKTRTCGSLPPTLCSIIHHTWTVPEQTKDNTISLGLWDMT